MPGRLTWRVSRQGEELIAPSTLGLVCGGKTLGAGVASLDIVRRYNTDERRPWRGGKREIVDRSLGLVIAVRGPSGIEFNVELRVSDTGVALRYLLDEADPTTVTDDLTQLQLPTGSQVWAAVPHEEAPVAHATLSADGRALARPAMVPMTETSCGTYLTLLEANRRDFPGLRHVEDRGGGRFKARIAGPYEGSGEITTPWRTLLIASSLDQLVNADLYRSLADPP